MNIISRNYVCIVRGFIENFIQSYEDYRLCQIKGFVENMPYLSFLEFVEKCERINAHIKWEFTQKLNKEAKNKNIETLEEYTLYFEIHYWQKKEK